MNQFLSLTHLVFIVLCFVSSSKTVVHSLSCTDPLFHCLSCQSQGTCSQCQTGFYSLNYSQPCLNCSAIQGCNQCNDNFGCSQCTGSYLHVKKDAYWTCLQNGTCKESSYHCKVCHANGCDQCENGFYKMDYFEKCRDCSNITGCGGVCNDFFGCAQCRTGYSQVKDPKNETHRICQSTRTKCDCTPPIANPSCPFAYQSSCVPVSVQPANAASLDPLDCALWNWVTTCETTCDTTNGCDNIPKPAFNCTKPKYTCTSLNGTCKWDYVCEDIVIQCFGSMCDCGFTTPTLNCTGGAPPVCDCFPTADQTCVTSMSCPPVNTTVTCAQDGCLNCYDHSKQAPNCTDQAPSACVTQCSAYTKCGPLENNTCGYTYTTDYLTCINNCQTGNGNSNTPQHCDSSLALCPCLATPNCIYLLFQTSFTIGSLADVSYNYGKCVNVSSVGAYVNNLDANAVTTNTPGVRAQCINADVPVYPDDVLTLLSAFSSDAIIQNFQQLLSASLTPEISVALDGVTVILSGVIPPVVNESNPNGIVVTLVVDVVSPTGTVDTHILASLIKNVLSARLSSTKTSVSVGVDVVQITSSSKRSNTFEVSPISFLVTSNVEIVPQATPLDTPVDTPIEVVAPYDIPPVEETPPVDVPTDSPIAAPQTPTGDSIQKGSESDSNRLTVIVAVTVVVFVVLFIAIVVFLVVRHKRNTAEQI